MMCGEILGFQGKPEGNQSHLCQIRTTIRTTSTLIRLSSMSSIIEKNIRTEVQGPNLINVSALR